jgi:hypothetical protein
MESSRQRELQGALSSLSASRFTEGSLLAADFSLNPQANLRTLGFADLVSEIDLTTDASSLHSKRDSSLNIQDLA